MKKRTLLAAAVAALLLVPVTLPARPDDFKKAENLYRKGHFGEARTLFERIGRERGDVLSEGWAVLCAVRMQAPGCDALAGDYITRHPESILNPQLWFRLGLNSFDAEDYPTAYTRFEQADPGVLYEAQKAEYYYKKAYCEFSRGDFDHAEELFEKVVALPYGTYTGPARYSLGYIDYSRKDFRKALEWFEMAAKDWRFEQIAQYYMLECRFNLKDYQYVIDHVDMYGSVPEDRKPHLARIISESYLVLGDAEKAREYYGYADSGGEEKTRKDWFYAGSVLYAVEDFKGAIENYLRMDDRTDSLGQIANYQLGWSYLQTKNKVAALDAFREAAQVRSDAAMQEDAYFNWAKLAFDLNHDTSVFSDYLRKYDALKKGDIIYSYMAVACLYNHDYEGAVDAYDHIEELDSDMRSNYMKAYFLRAHELVENGSWRAAVPYLKTAAYYTGRQDPFNQLSRYWMAESYYRDEQYDDARSLFTDLYNLSALEGKNEGDLLPYNVAYCYFRQGDFANATKWFNTYLRQPRKTYAADAATRIADGYFYSKDYRSAVTAYTKMISDYPDDDLYPVYQAGLAQGLLNDRNGKVKVLEQVLGTSPDVPWWSESMYELGRAYVTVKQDDDAARVFERLRADTQDKTFVARALIELGMLNRNRQRYSEALNYYKQVAGVLPDSEYSENALLAIESIYRTMGDPDGYLAYIERIGADKTEMEKEDMYFNTAEQIFLDGSWQKALATFENYRQLYPESAHAAQADFYMGECCRNLDRKEAAREYYRRAIDAGGDGSFVEQARINLAGVSYSLGHYDDAFREYSEARRNAQLDDNRYAATRGMMRSAWRSHSYSEAIAAADELVRDKRITRDDAREADWVKAKSYLATSRRPEAFALLEKLAESPSTPEGAEAAYLVIQDRFDQGKFEGIEDKVYDFAAAAGGQRYWLAKAFIVLGDSFAERENFAQAKATFESIRDGYVPSGTSDDVLDQIAIRLSKLQ